MRDLEPEHRDALLTTMVGREPLEVRRGKVVEGGDGGITLRPLRRDSCLDRLVSDSGGGGEGDGVGVDGGGGEGGGGDGRPLGRGGCLVAPRPAARFEVAIRPQKTESAAPHLARTCRVLLVHLLVHLLARDHELDARRVGR